MDFTEYDTRLAAYALITDEERLLVTWFNGAGGATPCWTLPGGGVEYDESVEEAAVREVHEETGHHVALHEPLAVHSFTRPEDPRYSRPFKAIRVVFSASIVGGSLGTLEVGGTTDFAAWMPPEQVASEQHADIVDIGLSAWRSRRSS